MSGQTNRDKWIEGWTDLMVDIWLEKMVMLNVSDTGALARSFDVLSFTGNGDSYAIAHTFLEYGLYVDRGTGREFKKGNPGDLGFHPTREPKKWFSLKYYASYMNLKEFLERSYKDEFVMMMKESLAG